MLSLTCLSAPGTGKLPLSGRYQSTLAPLSGRLSLRAGSPSTTNQQRFRLSPTASAVDPDAAADRILKKATQGSKVPNSKKSAILTSGGTGIGVFSLLLLNIIVFVLDLFFPSIIRAMWLNHAAARWWQFISCAFCHVGWEHLSNNLFLLFVFGRIVEEEEGAAGVWVSYLLSAVGGSVASYLTMRHAGYSLGASGAVFGLFAVSVLCKLSFNLKKLLEAAILGQFVVKQVLQEVSSQGALMRGGYGATLGGHSIGHIAHLGGAAAGVLLVFALSKIPAPANA
ncbi:hypothetical protein WJX84_001104 [Apatococcus fuscideae]|uniref:Peptidase S54 rhomboid domain-containing protein n=1 Tax=Apatococcus fuscideae TaxID=2026836 RepID=A0AAW1TEB9_9CHLO